MDPRVKPQTDEVDPMVATAVADVRDRFGAEGLRDLIALATRELNVVEQAERDLAAAVEAPAGGAAGAGNLDSADTQAWLAYREADAERDR